MVFSSKFIGVLSYHSNDEERPPGANVCCKMLRALLRINRAFPEFIGLFPHHSKDKERPTGDEMCLESIALLRIHRALLRIYKALFRIHRALSHHSNGKERPTGAKNTRPSGPKLMAGPTCIE